MRRVCHLQLLALAGFVWASGIPAGARPVYVPNGSFERPTTVFADPRLEGWQKTPKPFWFDEGNGFTWDQLTGVFRNTEPGKPDHIDNIDGTQALFLFAVPEVGIFRDSVGAGATFKPGHSYTLTAGIVGGGGGMTNGASLEMSLYYLDADGGRNVVAATQIVHDPMRFPSQTRLVDVELKVPSIRPTDPWLGRPMGVRFLSTVDPARAGGYWDLDHVRLTETIDLPNASFESPSTEFVDNRVDRWQKTAKPAWYDESGGFTWEQLSGVFRNTEPGKDDHLLNADGNQAFYLFAVPTAGLFLDATVGPEGSPFHARFEAGRSYAFTLAVQGGGGGMTNGATLELSLYYRDAEGLPRSVASTVVTHDAAAFPSRQHLVDFRVRTPPVRPSDPWADRGLGIQVMSTVAPALAGGYWNLDHARLEILPEPALLAPTLADGRFHVVLASEPGAKLEIQRSAGLAGADTAWIPVGTITNASGFTEFSEPRPVGEQHWYRLRQIP